MKRNNVPFVAFALWFRRTRVVPTSAATPRRQRTAAYVAAYRRDSPKLPRATFSVCARILPHRLDLTTTLISCRHPVVYLRELATVALRRGLFNAAHHAAADRTFSMPRTASAT